MNTLLSLHKQDGDEDSFTLRPKKLSEFVGQKQICEYLKISISAAQKRKESLDHILFYGPPGLGKTTLARILAKEMGSNLKTTAGPIISKSGDLASLLTHLEEGDILFIDEIHRLHAGIEEILYPAMEDFRLDLMIGSGIAARSVSIDLPNFTLVGATTRAGLITTPLRDRFGMMLHVNFYTDEELASVVLNQASCLGMKISYDSALIIAKSSRGTPRVSGRLIRRVRDIATVDGVRAISVHVVKSALHRLNIDSYGLDAMDRLYLQCLANHYNGGPVGGETLAAALGNEKDVLEDIVEPFLLQKGFIQRSQRGRLLTTIGWDYLNKIEGERLMT